MQILSILFALLAIIIIGVIYQRYLEKQVYIMPNDKFDELRKYLLTEGDLHKTHKPIMWVHIPHEYNARHWSSFGSRSSTELNQPYLYLTTRSIIKECDDSFKIVMIDDGSFKKLIPNWSINMDTLAEPTLSNVRQMAMAKLLYIYGGMTVPISFLCFKDLIGLYLKGTNSDRMFVCENVNTNITSTTNMFYPDTRFMGAKKGNHTMNEYIEFVQRMISHDFTTQLEFLGDFDRWLNHRVNKKQIYLIPGIDVGTKTVDDEPVIVDTLLGTDYIKFYDKSYGIWIPSDQILKRTNYEWFARMSASQIFQSRCILCKHFVNELAPKEGFYNEVNNDESKNKKSDDWVSYWRVPLDAPVWGLKPNDLGDNVPRLEYPNN